MPTCWIEVNLGAIRRNFRAIAELVGAETSIIAVIKANAYGHGTVEVGRALADEGAKLLAVTHLDEAIPLRKAGIQAPTLLLAPALPDQAEAVVEHDFTACVTNFEDGQRLSAAAVRQNKVAKAHLKINSGMGRLGVEPGEAVELAKRLAQLPNFKIEAAFTHFSDAADRRAAQVSLQYGKFQPLIHHLSRALEIAPREFHCANSATLLRFPSLRLSCVRPGTILYGQFPSSYAAEAAVKDHVQLHDTFAVKARIISIKELSPGQKVGYGSEWTANRPSRIATIAVGYADGLTQQPNARQEPPAQALKRAARDGAKQIVVMAGMEKEEASRRVSIGGHLAYIIGRIAMQQCSIDITHLEQVQVGDEVSLFMRRTSAGAHLPRTYLAK